MSDIAKLAGNWEVRGVIGTRIEIVGNQMTILWQGAEVLKTTFHTQENGQTTELLPAEKGLCNPGASKKYADVSRLYYENGRLHLIKDFPISGLSEDILTPTDRSRYGNVIVRDDLLASVQGAWKSTDGYSAFRIEGDRMTINNETFRIHAVIPARQASADGFSVIHQDPAVHHVGFFEEMVFSGDEMIGSLLICDVGIHKVSFKRVSEKK